ncbi:MAG: CDP-alcohol phosphatidyltransferase family protein [Candidatus Magasanikbacteria bacterium]|nr:CDP-alcohol phosphatidyltransferase family protein [Candidatus Magasanikbacteria bacterium]
MSDQTSVTVIDRFLAKVFLPVFPHWVLPNHLTALRLFLTPFVIWLFWKEQYLVGGILFLLTSFTDALDGAMARTRNQVTGFGKLFDPLADKILISTVVYILVLKYVNVYAAWIIIILEFIIISAAFIKKTNGGQNIQSNIWGKIKMNLQVWGVVILVLSVVFNIEQLLAVSQGTFYLAIAFAIMSLFTYGI